MHENKHIGPSLDEFLVKEGILEKAKAFARAFLGTKGKFTTSPSIGDQILDSILEEPKKWKVRYSGGEAVSQVHRSGLEIWTYLLPRDVRIYSPELNGVKFTDEEQKRIYNAVTQLRKDRAKKERIRDEKKAISMLNENPLKLLIVIIIILIVILGLIF